MLKQDLYKLFYADYEIHKKEYERRYTSEDTIKFDFKIGEWNAFFCPTLEIYKLLLSIQKLDKEVNRLCNLLPSRAISQFEYRCMIDEIVLTNNIEGIYSTRKEINSILSNLSKQDEKKRFLGLVKKYLALIQGDKIPLNSCQDIRKIYDEIFLYEIKTSNPENIPDGELFRKGSVSVYSATQKEIHRGVYPEDKIIEMMKMALDVLHDSNLEPLIKISIFHYLFGYIHPFYDGNGRISRFISSYLLSNELNHLIGYRISYTIKENIKHYYDAFKICNHFNNKGDLTPFVTVFLEIINLSEQQLCEALSKRVTALNHYKKVMSHMFNGDSIMSDLYEALIQASLFSNSGISIRELEECLDLSYNTVNKYLKMIPEQILVKRRQNRNLYCRFDLNEFDKYIDSLTIMK